MCVCGKDVAGVLCELLVRSCQKADLRAACGRRPHRKELVVVLMHLWPGVIWGTRPKALPHLSVVVQVPQIQTTHAVHAGEERGVHGGPHHIVDVICVILKGVQRLVLLRGTQHEKKEVKYHEKGGIKGQTGQARRCWGCKGTSGGRESG